MTAFTRPGRIIPGRTPGVVSSNGGAGASAGGSFSGRESLATADYKAADGALGNVPSGTGFSGRVVGPKRRFTAPRRTCDRGGVEPVNRANRWIAASFHTAADDGAP